MALYFGATEITNIDNLVPQTGLDITDIWFGETNVYTVWQVYEGTLPATLNANGDDMRQYQVYGNAGGVGDRTDNKFDYQKYFETCTQFNSYFDYAPLQLKPNTQYVVYTNCLSGTSGSQAQNIETSVIICPAEVTFNTANGGVYGNTPFTLTTQASGLCNIGMRTEHGTYASFTEIYEESDFASGAAYINIAEGTAVSEIYVPYGYEVDISVSDGTNAVTTPIYIGSDPLDKDEYTDYQAQKVYRRTENHFDVRKVSQNTFLGEYNVTGASEVSDTSDYIYVKNFSYSLLKSLKTGAPFNTTTRVFCFYGSQKNFLGRQLSLTYHPGDIVNGVAISIPSNAEYVRFSYDKRYSGEVMFILSDSAITPPETYIPYLQPTDPPVPLPALPTCEGTTIVGYAGSGTTPEKVLLKYRKEGY